MHQATFASGDGVRIFYRSWEPEDRPRAIVVINHGFNSHGGQYLSTAGQFFDHAGSSDRTLKLYDGHYHDLLNDYGKDKVFADIRGWIDAHLQ